MARRFYGEDEIEWMLTMKSMKYHVYVINGKKKADKDYAKKGLEQKDRNFVTFFLRSDKEKHLKKEYFSHMNPMMKTNVTSL